MEETALMSQCLKLSQTLALSGHTFSINIVVGDNFNFSLETRKKDEMKKKKISPSGKKRSEERRRKYLESRKPRLPPTSTDSTDDIVTENEDTEVAIPQIDGADNLASPHSALEWGVIRKFSFCFTVTLHMIAFWNP